MKTAMDIPDKEGQKRLVIVGGGFGGLKLARKLKSNKFQIVLLDKNNHHIFQPLLYQVATAGIEPSAISFPYRKIFKKREHFHIRICEAQQVFPEHNLLETSIGTLAYDYLVIATGCNTNYFGNDGLEKQTMALKNTSEALFNRNQILDSFEQAQNTGNKEDRRRLMTFAIVGGGATGIELAGALAEMRKFVLPQDYPDLNINEMRIILLDGSSRLLSAFSEESSKEVADYLKKRDVEIKLNQRVMGYENYQLALNDGTAIDTKNVFCNVTPDHNTINCFHSSRLKDVLKTVFATIVKFLVAEGFVSLDVAFTDGTKMEANANRYTFVWGKSIHTRISKIAE